MPEWTQTLGVWIREDFRKYKRGNSQNNIQKEIIFELIKKLPKHNSFKMRLVSSNKYILPYRWLGFKIEPTFSYRINFSYIKDFDLIKQKYSKHINRDINGANRKIHIEESCNIEDLIKLRDLTFKRQNRRNPVDTRETYNIIDKILKINGGRLIYGINEDGKVYNCAFTPYDKESCYYLMAYNNPEYQASNTMCLLTNDCINFAFENSDFFDFEGSMVEGIENYFRAFGGNQIINYELSRQSLINDCLDTLKPHIKKIIGYRV